MELSSHKIKVPVFCRRPHWGVFITAFSCVFIVKYWFSPLFFGCFHRWLHFFMSPAFFTLTAFFLLFIRYFVFVLLYREYYRFERAYFTLRCFLPYTTSRNLAQPAFIKVSLEAGSFFLKVAGPPTEVQNTDPTHLFVWSTQYSAKGINRQVLFMCYGPTERYINLFQVLNSLFNSYIYCIVKCHIW